MRLWPRFVTRGRERERGKKKERDWTEREMKIPGIRASEVRLQGRYCTEDTVQRILYRE